MKTKHKSLLKCQKRLQKLYYTIIKSDSTVFCNDSCPLSTDITALRVKEAWILVERVVRLLSSEHKVFTNIEEHIAFSDEYSLVSNIRIEMRALMSGLSKFIKQYVQEDSRSEMDKQMGLYLRDAKKKLYIAESLLGAEQESPEIESEVMNFSYSQ